MALDELIFWQRRAVLFFSERGGAAPGSAVASVETRAIDDFVKTLRGAA